MKTELLEAASFSLGLHLLAESLELLLLQLCHHFIQGINLCSLSLFQLLLSRFLFGSVPSVRSVLLFLFIFAARRLHDFSQPLRLL
uniref:Uncharacterized protein n=1 Tax=Anguilla anguilla TaxID=7936 RepID=A0A0E9XGX0_ANGAN